MSSMYTVNGQLINAYQEERTKRDTGEKYVVHRIQVMGSMPTRDNGGEVFDLDTLTVTDHLPYLEHIGKNVQVPIGMFAPAKNDIRKYVPKGTNPEVM